ncbi:MAG: hypothetical protein AAGF20_07505 [Pseudomonadota bacterium]
MSEKEWGPWIEHDGGPCRCVGCFVHADWEDGGIEPLERASIAIGSPEAWVRNQYLWHDKMIRYRIRKPCALQELKERIATLPEEVDA